VKATYALLLLLNRSGIALFFLHSRCGVDSESLLLLLFSLALALAFGITFASAAESLRFCCGIALLLFRLCSAVDAEPLQLSCAIAALSRCNRCAFDAHLFSISLYTRCVFTAHSLGNRLYSCHALAAQSLCTRSAITLQLMRSRSAIA
jgi:hypothetical protein